MKNERILVVDDDREIVRAIAILLEQEGFHPVRAYDGMQALEILAKEQIQLVLIDVMMPKMDGLSAIMKIRERQNIPIIVLSAKSEETDKVLGLSIGADDYVAKPYNPAELVARVKSHLRRYVSWRHECQSVCRRDSQWETVVSHAGSCTVCRRRTGSSDSYRDKNCGSSDAQSRQDFPGGRDLSACLGGGKLCV